MKLIDLLREHLPAWPNGCIAITQDSTCENGVFYWRVVPYFNKSKGEWVNRNNGTLCGLVAGDDFSLAPKDDPDATFGLCEDYDTAIISRELYEAKMKEPVQVKPIDVIAARDRIIEIEEMQVKLQNEKRELYSHISAMGFKLDLGAMKK